MVLSTLIQRNSLLVGSEESVWSMKIISQSFIKPSWPSWVFMTCYESDSINCEVYILNTTNLTWKKVNQAFAITIKSVVYLINFFGHETLISVSLFYVATSFTSALPTTKCIFSLTSGYTLALTRWFLKL